MYDMIRMEYAALKVIRAYFKQVGKAPSLTELSWHCGRVSDVYMIKVLKSLHKQGLIVRTPKVKRGIVLVDIKETA